jgi:hypothetical protein
MGPSVTRVRVRASGNVSDNGLGKLHAKTESSFARPGQPGRLSSDGSFFTYRAELLTGQTEVMQDQFTSRFQFSWGEVLN